MTKFFTLSATCLLFAFNLSSQNKKTNLPNNQFFDKKTAVEQSIARGMKASEINGYVQFLKNDFSSKKALAQQPHKHSPYESNGDVLEKIIYLNPNKTNSAGCPNMGFEQLSFSGWTGETGTTSSGTSSTMYTTVGTAIINTAGNNVSLVNTINYHTLMSLPATNPIYPSCNGYDSIACKAVGSNTISQIPVVSPYSQDPVSVRMNAAVANYRASRLKYIATSGTNNKILTFSFALVLENGAHPITDAPYFRVEVRNETTGTLLSGCNSFTINSAAVSPSDSLFPAVIGPGDVFYRKWQLYTVDLSTLPLGTNVSVMFEVGDCAQGGHWGYAYVDAECGANQIITSSMCSGASTALLTAPIGYASYQWFDPSNSLISGATTNTLSVSSPTIGNVYYIQLTSNNGCIETKTVAIASSTININNISVTGSCPSGNSGSATVNPSGSNTTYSYTWTSISTGSVVSNSQTATNLSPGNYSVAVSSGLCGQTSGTVSVPIAPPSFSSQYKSFCGNNTYISTNTGSNYQWYSGTGLIIGPLGTNDTLYISNASNNDLYTVVYTNMGNCRDSIRYTLTQVAGGYTNISNINNVCPSNTNGSAALILSPINSAPYTFIVKSTAGTIVNSTTSSTTYSVTNLSAGSYTSIVSDGNCSYSNVFTISTISTNFTMTPGPSSSCSPADTARINFNFGNTAPATCGIDPSLCTSGAQTTLFASGTFTQNGSTSYPTPYGNWYTYGKTQYLIKQSDLNAAGITAGKISSLAFNVLAMNTSITTYPNFYINMGCTNLGSLPDVTTVGAQPFITGLQNVYSSANQPVALGWTTHNFSQSYVWDGTSNIIVEVCFGMNTPSNYTQNVSVELKQLSYVSSMYHVEDANSVCNGTQLADNFSGSLVTSGQYMIPNMKFGYCPYSPPVSSYSIAVSSNGTIVQNNNNDSIKVVPLGTPTAAVVYTITVTNPQGSCTASQTFTMSSSLSAVTTVTNASCGSCPNGSVQVIPNCGTAPYNYVWSPGGATTQSVSGLLPGCYTVTVTDVNLNSVTRNACVSFSTKLEDVTAASGLSIYPNPSNGVFNVLSETIIDKLDITVINPLGQTVIQESLKNTKQATVDLSKLSKGIYYLKTNTDTGSKLFKLILE